MKIRLCCVPSPKTSRRCGSFMSLQIRSRMTPCVERGPITFGNLKIQACRPPVWAKAETHASSRFHGTVIGNRHDGPTVSERKRLTLAIHCGCGCESKFRTADYGKLDGQERRGMSAKINIRIPDARRDVGIGSQMPNTSEPGALHRAINRFPTNLCSKIVSISVTASRRSRLQKFGQPFEKSSATRTSFPSTSKSAR